MSHHHHHHHHHNNEEIIEKIIIVEQPNQQYQQGYNQQYQQQYNPYQQYNTNQQYQQNYQQQYDPNQQYQQQYNPNQQYQQNFNQNQFQQQNYQQQNYNQQYQQQGYQQNYNQNQFQQNQYQQQMQQYDPFYSQQRRVFNLQEKWFSITNNLGIYNEQGKQEYLAQGKFFHLGLDMYLKDVNGNTLCEIKSKIFSLMAEYDFYQNGSLIGKIRKEIKLFKEGWHFTDLKKNQSWEISGDFLNYDWKIHNGNTVCGEVSRKHSFIKDAYGILIEPGSDITLIICVAVCMEKYHHDHHLKH